MGNFFSTFFLIDFQWQKLVDNLCDERQNASPENVKVQLNAYNIFCVRALHSHLLCNKIVWGFFVYDPTIFR